MWIVSFYSIIEKLRIVLARELFMSIRSNYNLYAALSNVNKKTVNNHAITSEQTKSMTYVMNTNENSYIARADVSSPSTYIRLIENNNSYLILQLELNMHYFWRYVTNACIVYIYKQSIILVINNDRVINDLIRCIRGVVEVKAPTTDKWAVSFPLAVLFSIHKFNLLVLLVIRHSSWQ